MIVKITGKRQITLPARVLDALGLSAGDRLELREGPDGFILRPYRIDRTRLAPLRGKLRKGRGTFDLESVRDDPHDPAHRI
jgi:AbrB family looped-hinge helix DNA binding protein